MFPHQQDTGGFFITVIQKVGEMPPVPDEEEVFKKKHKRKAANATGAAAAAATTEEAANAEEKGKEKEAEAKTDDAAGMELEKQEKEEEEEEEGEEEEEEEADDGDLAEQAEEEGKDTASSASAKGKDTRRRRHNQGNREEPYLPLSAGLTAEWELVKYVLLPLHAVCVCVCVSRVSCVCVCVCHVCRVCACVRCVCVSRGTHHNTSWLGQGLLWDQGVLPGTAVDGQGRGLSADLLPFVRRGQRSLEELEPLQQGPCLALVSTGAHTHTHTPLGTITDAWPLPTQVVNTGIRMLVKHAPPDAKCHYRPCQEVQFSIPTRALQGHRRGRSDRAMPGVARVSSGSTPT